jgi:tetratricopeptide (TPR) repeat protein
MKARATSLRYCLNVFPSQEIVMQDSFELEVTTRSIQAVALIDRFYDQLLSVGNDTQAILQAVEADPTSVFAHTLAAVFYLFIGTTEATQQSQHHLTIANQNLENANDRERLYVAAVTAWANRDIQQATIYHEAIAEEFPRDLVSVNLCQYHYRNLGSSQAMLEIAEKVFLDNQENPYMHGMIAFGLEECHRIEETEAAGRYAVALKRNHPWAHHAVVHVLEAQGRLQEGIAWIEGVSDTWEQCNPAFYSHLWWHTALYYLDAEQFDRVLELYDFRVWGRARKSYGRDQINAISLLMRLNLQGIDVGSRWLELATYLHDRLHEHNLAFMDLHYVYALVRGGKATWASEMLTSMETYAEQALPSIRSTWKEVALPAAYGMIAHAQGNWESAIILLEPTLPRLQETGGSHAERDLFEQIYLDALLQAERYSKALPLLEKRNAARNNIPVIQKKLRAVYTQILSKSNQIELGSA